MVISDMRTSTSNSLGREYQVFISFRGPDTRRGFANVLYRDLFDAGIHVFIDYEEIRLGERIDGELLRAINDSRLYIPILSPSYASSYWCLCELAKMVENISNSGEDENKKMILPIFYNVKPDDVKLRIPLYENQIQNLEQMVKDKKKNFNSEDADTWRRALKTVGGISGLDSDNYLGDGDLSKSVVEEVVNRLQTRQRKVTKDLVGMEDRIAAINNLLNIDSGGVRLIGIYGMGGIGKTTLAKLIFNQLCPRFGKNCSFLFDVRETAKTKGLLKLQEQLLSTISNSRVACNISDIDHGIYRIGERICNKKVLIVLDDVDEAYQIQELIGMNSLYPGTIILITTRDKRVFKIRGFKYEIVTYEMEGLHNKDALQLFSRHAFDNNSPPADYYTLSKNIVSTTAGLPLALQAIGSLLFQKERKIWKEMLEKLRKTPHGDVMGKLRISYDTLETDQQQIFLDIACFFISENKINPIYVWKDCGFSPEYAIDVLINRCMIKVLDDDSFWMHDQYRDLGRAIANKERTRLWVTDDCICELRSTKTNGSVQALSVSGLCIQPPIVVTPKHIKRFPHLLFLWLRHATCQGDFTGCLSKLRWISLHYPYEIPKPKFHPRFKATHLHLENVVVMNLFGIGFTEDKVRSLMKGARKLKVLTLQNFWSTYKTPTFSEYSVLEKLTISSFPLLVEIDCSIGKLRWLTDLSVMSCSALGKLPEQIGELKNLQHLCLRGCGRLSELPESVWELNSLTKLDVSYTSILGLPDSIGGLTSLSSLNVSETPVANMPGTMSKLRHLRTLELSLCHEIQELPKLPKSLTTLRLVSKSLQTVPNLSMLTNLVELVLSDVFGYTSKSNIIQPCDLRWIGRLSKLRNLELCLLNVHAPSTELGSLSLLKELTLDGLDLQTLKQLPSNLTFLQLYRTRVKQMQLDGLSQLERLIVKECEILERLPITSSLRNLREVGLSSCPKLVEVQFLGVLKSMGRLYIKDCKSFERLICLSEELQAPELTYGGRRLSLVSSSLKMLQEFQLSRCPELQEIQFVSTLESLEEFSVEGCISLKRLSGLSNLKNLNDLSIEGCKNLQVIEGINELEFLHRLKVYSCGSMERFIDASSSKIPNECRIKIKHCGELLGGGSNLSFITWKSYREKILNGAIKELDSETEILESETETGDPLLKTQDNGDMDDYDESEYADSSDDESKDSEDDEEADEEEAYFEKGSSDEHDNEEEDYEDDSGSEDKEEDEGKDDEDEDGMGFCSWLVGLQQFIPWMTVTATATAATTTRKRVTGKKLKKR